MTKRKAKKGETPSPQMEKKTKQVIDNSDTDTATEDSECETFSLEGKSDSEMLKFLCSKIGGIMSELRRVNKKQDKIMKKLNGLEKKVAKHTVEITELKTEQQEMGEKLEEMLSAKVVNFDPEVTLVAINTPYYVGEDPVILAKHLLRVVGCGDMTVVNAMRTPQKDKRPGVLKIQLPSKVDKIDVLRKKGKLKDSDEFNKVYIRSSKSHSDRLAELNMKTLLSEIPNGSTYRILGNGRVVKRDSTGVSEPSSYRQRELQPTYAAVASSYTGGLPPSSQLHNGMSSQLSQHITYNSHTQHETGQGLPVHSATSDSFGQDSQMLTDFGSQPVSAQVINSNLTPRNGGTVASQ